MTCTGDQNMSDKPAGPNLDPKDLPTRDLLLTGILGKDFLKSRLTELVQSAFVPSLILFDAPAPTADQKVATRWYSETKFPESGDEKSLPTNKKARELALKQIDEDPTALKGGRITSITLKDPFEKALLLGWMTFPFAYEKSEQTAQKTGSFGTKAEAELFAEFQREGFRLALKQQGFDLAGKKIDKDLSKAEQLKLDCLTFFSLSRQAAIGEKLPPIEAKAMADAAERLNKALAADKPEDFIKNLKAALGECKTEADRKILITGIAAFLDDQKAAKPLIDSFEKWLTTKYSEPLEKQLYKDPEKLKQWFEKNDPDLAKKIPEKADSDKLLAWLRSLHTDALADRWVSTMKTLATAEDRNAFQYFANIVLGDKDRFGASAGLFKGLNDLAMRKDGKWSEPADPDKVATAIKEAGNDPANVSSKARQPGEFARSPFQINLTAPPEEWKWYTWAFGVPLAAIGAWAIGRQIPIVKWPFLGTEWLAKKGYEKMTGKGGASDDAATRLRDDKMSRDRTKSDFKTDATDTFKGLDPAKKPTEAGKKVAKFMSDFGMRQKLDGRLDSGKLKVEVVFTTEAVEASDGMHKAKVTFTTEGENTTMKMTFPADATPKEMAHDCYLSLYEMGRQSQGTEKALSRGDRAHISGEYTRLGLDFGESAEVARDTASERLPDRAPTRTAEPVKIAFGPDGVTIGTVKCPIDEVTRAIRDELKDKFEKAKQDGKKEGDAEYDNAKKAYEEHETILKNLASEDSGTRETARKAALEKVKTAFEADDGKLKAKFSEDLSGLKGDERTRSRFVVVSMLAARYAAPTAAAIAIIAVGSRAARASETKKIPLVPLVVPKKEDK